jgi:hypothetical protein
MSEPASATFRRAAIKGMEPIAIAMGMTPESLYQRLEDEAAAQRPQDDTGAHVAELFVQWAHRDGILARVTKVQCADLARAFIAGYLTARAAP